MEIEQDFVPMAGTTAEDGFVWGFYQAENVN